MSETTSEAGINWGKRGKQALVGALRLLQSAAVVGTIYILISYQAVLVEAMTIAPLLVSMVILGIVPCVGVLGFYLGERRLSTAGRFALTLIPLSIAAFGCYAASEVLQQAFAPGQIAAGTGKGLFVGAVVGLGSVLLTAITARALTT